MLQITVQATEKYDEKTNTFIYSDEHVLQLEHSLVSISKWESRWHKPFLSKEEKTHEETIDYIRCMTITQKVPSSVYDNISHKNIQEVNAYIEDPMTATTITKDESAKFNRGIVTAEIIYYWMITLQIPVEFQKWHLNRLLTLIEVCNVKNGPEKKMTQQEIMARNRALNAKRRKEMNSKG